MTPYIETSDEMKKPFLITCTFSYVYLLNYTSIKLLPIGSSRWEFLPQGSNWNIMHGWHVNEGKLDQPFSPLSLQMYDNVNKTLKSVSAGLHILVSCLCLTSQRQYVNESEGSRCVTMVPIRKVEGKQTNKHFTLKKCPIFTQPNHEWLSVALHYKWGISDRCSKKSWQDDQRYTTFYVLMFVRRSWSN